jgi:hypothetical protein
MTLVPNKKAEHQDDLPKKKSGGHVKQALYPCMALLVLL